MDERHVMAGMTTYRRPESAIEIEAREASQKYFGGMMAELEAGQNAVAFRRGYMHRKMNVTEYVDFANPGFYEKGFQNAE